MQYYSEKTQKIYKDVKELEKAEKEFDNEQQRLIKQKKEEEIKVAKLKEERETRAKEIELAIQARDEAQKKVNQLTKAFIEDYGSWHYTFRRSGIDGVINDFFKFW